jgi:hypothetical protein
MSWQTLQNEQEEWALHNFGYRETWQPILGVVEELGELEMAETLEDTYDAIGDVAIYLCDACTGLGLRAEQVWARRGDGTGAERSAGDLAGALAHAFLTYQQGIRAVSPTLVASALAAILVALEAKAQRLFASDVESIALDVWQDVKKRDWRQYPVNGVSR